MFINIKHVLRWLFETACNFKLKYEYVVPLNNTNSFWPRKNVFVKNNPYYTP